MLFIIQMQEADSVSPCLADDLIRRLATGDKDALAELYRETRAAVYGFSLSIVKNTADAEDILQDTYLKVYSSAAGYRSRGSAMAWILTIAKNLCLMKLREKNRFRDLEPHEWEATATVDAPCEDRQLLQAAMCLLSDEERQVILLHALSGMKHREIAALLDLALPTVLSKYHRALRKLRKYLEGADAQ